MTPPENTNPIDEDHSPGDSATDGLATRSKWPAVTIFIALYAVAVVVLAWRLEDHPEYPYNWESYTLRGLIDFQQDPTSDIFRLNNGLMTDSGRSAVVVLPAWLGFELEGRSLLGLRLPIVLISALVVPLTWLLGRRVYSNTAGLTAAALVLTSQVFLFYGRTGTIVGMSLAPALIGYLVLWRCLAPSRHWLTWLVGLQGVLILCSYFYAPIRFLWLIAIVLFVVEWLLRAGERRRFLISLLLTATTLPAVAVILQPGPILTPDEALIEYYHGRGEQIFYLNEHPERYVPFLQPESEAERERLEQESTSDLAWRLVRSNATDLANLLIDRNTKPAITDFYQPSGRLYPKVLVPFFLAGMALLVFRFVADPRARFLLALFWGFSLPMILTSRVHIGRLIFIVPLLALIIALPGPVLVAWLRRRWTLIPRWSGLALGAAVFVLGAVPSLSDWRTDFPGTQMSIAESQIERVLEEESVSQLVLVFGDLPGYEVEGLRVADLEVLMDGELRFEDQVTGETRGSGRVTMMYGAMLPFVSEPALIPGYCDTVYLVNEAIADQFHDLSDEVARRECGRSLRVMELAL